MDKSFNDQELSDIMKEIEALEDDFHQEAPEAQKMEVIEEASSDVVEDLAEMSEEESIPKTNHSDSQVLSFEKSTPVASHKSPTTMSFKVQGEMNLELFFEVGGKTIALEVTESGLSIQMEGGVTFTVPVAGSGAVKKAI